MATADREAVQIKTFTRWTNSYVSKAGFDVQNLAEDFRDGLALAALLEAISGGEFVAKKLNKKPKMKLQKLENLNASLKFLESKVKLVNIGSSDIEQGNEKLVLGLLWTLILRYEVENTGADGKAGLLLWVQKTCKGYEKIDPPNVQNFTKDWNTGLPFVAIINRYRPDLMDYDPNMDALTACENAFRIAEEKLGIARLLDAADVANVAKPDEKSIIAYVSQFFKLFAAAAKNQNLLKSIKNAVEVTKRHDKWLSEYDGTASSVSLFVDGATSKFQRGAHFSCTADVKAALDDFQKYTSKTKPPQASARTIVEGLSSTLTASKKNNKRPAHAPSVPADEIALKWVALEGAESTYEKSLLEQYTRFRAVDSAASKFAARATPTAAWLKSKQETFSAGQVGSSAQEIESNIDMHESFETRLAQYAKLLSSDLKSLAAKVAELSAGKHVSEESVVAEMSALSASLEATKAAGAAHKKALQEALKREKEVIATERALLRAAETLEFELQNIDMFANEPVAGANGAEIADITKALAKHNADLKTTAGKVEELAKDATAIADRRPAFATRASGLQAKVGAVREALGKLEKDIAAASAEESAQEALRAKFANIANPTGKAFQEQNKVLAKLARTSGGLEAQLKKVREVRSTIDASSGDLATIKSISEECAAAGIVANLLTPHTVNSLQAEFEALTKAGADAEASLTAQLMAKQKMAITPEQMSDIRDTFEHFDADKSGALDVSEVCAACQGIGIDLEDSVVEAKVSEIAPTKKMLNLEEFTTFVIGHIRSGDTKEDVMSAFQSVSDGQPTVGDAALETLLASEPEVAAYVKENMKGGDYAAFVNDLFSR